MTQVVSNLVSNAIKFTQAGTISIISLETKKQEDGKDHVVISVKDTGQGIDSEILPRLFSKFATKSEIGTELGLFISKSIVQAHGARYGLRIIVMTQELHLHLVCQLETNNIGFEQHKHLFAGTL